MLKLLHLLNAHSLEIDFQVSGNVQAKLVLSTRPEVLILKTSRPARKNDSHLQAKEIFTDNLFIFGSHQQLKAREKALPVRRKKSEIVKYISGGAFISAFLMR